MCVCVKSKKLSIVAGPAELLDGLAVRNRSKQIRIHVSQGERKEKRERGVDGREERERGVDGVKERGVRWRGEEKESEMVEREG